MLVLLFGIAMLARRFLMRPGDSLIASGGIVMAGSIFVIAALGQFPFPELASRIVALSLLVIWVSIAFSYARSGVRGELVHALQQPANAFTVGTWVAGSAVLGRTLFETLPGWRPLEVALWVVVATLWVWCVGLLMPAFRAVWRAPGEQGANGAILLATVGTQSLVVSGEAVLPGGMLRWVAALIVLGYLFYAVRLVPLARRYLWQRQWNLDDHWDDINCILHGTVSITGLAVVQSGALPGDWAVATWVWVAMTFVLVESLEVARLIARARDYGWREGLLTYYVSQWARIFTFGMFYAFALQLLPEPRRSREASGAIRVGRGVRALRGPRRPAGADRPLLSGQNGLAPGARRRIQRRS
jgi:hypothetical protein